MLPFPITQLVQIVANGSGIEIDAKIIPKNDIVQIAAYAKGTGARIVVKNASTLSQQDIVQIAASGKPYIFFEA
jgi:hypothetical protein